MNLLGDFAAGGMMCAMGVLLALQERIRSGKGQVVDVAMVCAAAAATPVVRGDWERRWGQVDGAAYMASFIQNFRQTGLWCGRGGALLAGACSRDTHGCAGCTPCRNDAAGTNLLDSGAHFYEVYETKDGRHVAVCVCRLSAAAAAAAVERRSRPRRRSGAIEPHFYAKLLDGLGLAAEAHTLMHAQMDKSAWPAMKERFELIFASKTRDEWCARARAARERDKPPPPPTLARCATHAAGVPFLTARMRA